ncbi:MAG: CdaR family protein [Clostridiales bacterium]|nr:CdaR family protein [Clostridiales bacterium]
MKNKLTRNWGLKLGSFIFAAILWLVVTNINDPVGTYRVYNVPVKIQNADLITNSGQIYEVLDDTDVIDVVTVSAKRSIIDLLDESNIVAVADMNDLTSLNTIAIKLSTNKYNDKLESITGNIDSVKLNIENKRTKTLQLRTSTTGTVKEGYIVGDITTDQNLVEITGPDSIISQVKRASATVNVSGFTSNIGTDSVVKLYDENDNEIVSGSIVKNISKVHINVEILATKTVAININTTGTPAKGYQATGEVSSTKDSVIIAGRTKAIEDITAIEIPETALDITGATESLEQVIDINNYLPDGVTLAEENFNGKFTVNVSVEAEVERVITMPIRNVQIINVPEGYKAEIAEETTTYSLTLVGLARDIDEVDASAIVGAIDVTAYMDIHDIEEISEGVYLMELVFNLDETAALKETVRLNVEVTGVEE